MRYTLVDLAGFSPSEIRGGHGRWSKQADGGKQGKKPAKPAATHAALLHERASLQGQVKTLTALLSRLQPGKHGVHHGQAGVHRGAAGAHKATASHATKAAGGAGKENLAGEVAKLRVEVEHLKIEVVNAQQRRAKRRKK